MGLLSRIESASSARSTLSGLLSHVPIAKVPFEQKLEWLDEVFHWVRSPGTLAPDATIVTSGRLQVSRIKFFLNELSLNKELSQMVSAALRSLLSEMSCLDLFVRMGISEESSFFSEILSRIEAQFLPAPRLERDLAEFCRRNFSRDSDLLWLEALDTETLSKISALFRDPRSPDFFNLHNIDQDLFDSLVLLCSEISTLGLSQDLRSRRKDLKISDSPFTYLPYLTRSLGYARINHDETLIEKSFRELNENLEKCNGELELQTLRMEDHGVSVNLVFKLERINASIFRAKMIATLISGRDFAAQEFLNFLIQLLEENRRQRSLISLFSDNLSLLAKKIADRNAETGQHYIARKTSEFWALLKAAMGGGMLTSFTVLGKIAIEKVKLAAFVEGAALTLNYSVSFVLIQMLHFTLATKQPAMTAHALTDKMQKLQSEEDYRVLRKEVWHLLLSQGLAVFGNLLGVIPFALLWAFLFHSFSGTPLMNIAAAQNVLSKHAVFSFAALFAFYTGILLWASSLLAGWVDNWMVSRQLPRAFKENRTLRNFFGRKRLEALVDRFSSWVAPLTGNISLGLFLGMTPRIFEFFGLGLDVRHVTLATGALSTAFYTLGASVLKTPIGMQVIVGVLVIGIINVTTSFALSFIVALWARKLRGRERKKIFKYLVLGRH